MAAAAAASREAAAEEAVDSVLREALQRGGADRLAGAATHAQDATLEGSPRAAPAAPA